MSAATVLAALGVVCGALSAASIVLGREPIPGFETPQRALGWVSAAGVVVAAAGLAVRRARPRRAAALFVGGAILVFAGPSLFSGIAAALLLAAAAVAFRS